MPLNQDYKDFKVRTYASKHRERMPELLKRRKARGKVNLYHNQITVLIMISDPCNTTFSFIGLVIVSVHAIDRTIMPV